jgi:glycosyltransferase involved in cell wall biosynthesis
MTDVLPKVSIGMPVYNGATTVEVAIDALLAQSFRDFELIISDNASSDATEALCRQYAASDARVRYVRQSVNIGSARNFAFVLEQARAGWFMWAACDDVRSPDFLDVNLSFLEAHPDFVASTSPNGFVGLDLDEPVTF